MLWKLAIFSVKIALSEDFTVRVPKYRCDDNYHKVSVKRWFGGVSYHFANWQYSDSI